MFLRRYLRRTFQRAYAHTRPDVVVFLGDLLDEGTSATDNEFHEYWTRIQSIFAVDNNVQVSADGYTLYLVNNSRNVS